MPTLKQLYGGIVGGLAGGLAFGALIHAAGGMPMIARLAGGHSAVEGWALHLIISFITGVVFAFFFRKVISSYSSGAIYGLIYGVMWWVLGPLTIMPLWLGLGVQLPMAFTPTYLSSLVGHLIFGMVLGIVYRIFTKASVPMVVA